MHVDRELLWRKLFAFDHQPEDAFTGIQDSTDHLCGVIQTAVAHGRHEPLRQMLLQRLGYWLRSDVVPPFWSFFDALPTEIGRSKDVRRGRRHVALLCAQQLTLALQFAEDAVAHCVQIASLFDDHVQLKDGQPTMLQELRTTFRCLVFEDTRTVVKFEELLLIFFSMSFQKFRGKEKSQTFDSRPIRQTLLQLEWLHVAEPALLRVLYSQIKKVVKSTCGEVYDELFLTEVEQWACSELLPWLEEIMQTKDEASTGKWREILSRHVRQEFGSQRIKQLFEIIKEFPDSVPALEDLRLCLERTQQHGELCRSFEVHCSRGYCSQEPTRLRFSIFMYLLSSTLLYFLKAFRLLDPKGVLLEALSCPYLRKRKDTVRCIVQSLTDEQSGDLFEELRRDNMRIIQHDDDSDDDEDMSPDAWEPDPIEADPTKTSRSRSSDDILRILVNIYGSRELFVNEYRMMLADKLLQNLEFDTDRDVQTLELLKLRFGEDSLQQCEIMVRDIEDSKRLNGNVQSTLERSGATAIVAVQGSSGEEAKELFAQPGAPSTRIDATIVSQQFWPPLQGDDFVLHPKVSKDIDAFKDAYHVLRNPRSLEWNTSLGSVQLSIELEGEEREFNVSPLQATMILYFEEKDRWSVEELATKLEISADVLLKHVSLWVNHGLVSFASGRKELVASVSFQDTRCNDDSMVEELETAVSSDAQAEEDFKVLETYIVGMLSNFGSLSIQRIHNMLSTFARSGAQPYTKTISGLSVVLGKLVNTNKLEFVGGQYQLAK
ncbi:Anaphase promoting complex (APC) subunit 2 [Phytophthora infestans]|uniref:Anaphase-promoting complex subunit 2 n=1 Tax=Phytophthora infestans TaxID=4787 RepID=A0A833WHR5_PHYIN|nr:Anaphase promoting complex (APC) subunit 2 [Phytophthora infestans]